MLHGAVIWQRDPPVASAPQEQRWGESGKISRPEGLRSVSARAFAISFGATPSGRGRSKLWVRSGGWGQSIVKLKSKGTRSRGRCEASSPGGTRRKRDELGLRPDSRPLLPSPPRASAFDRLRPASHLGECLRAPGSDGYVGAACRGSTEAWSPCLVSLPRGKFQGRGGAEPSGDSPRRHRATVGHPCWLPRYQEFHG